MTLPGRSRRPRVAATVAGTLAATLLLPALPGSAAAPTTSADGIALDRGGARSGALPGAGDPDLFRSRPSGGPLVVQLELATASTSAAFAATRTKGLRAAADAADSQAARVRAAQDALVARLSSPATAATVLYRTSVLTSAVVVRTDASRLAALAALPGVVSARPISAKTRQNAAAVPLTGGPKIWASLGTGEGVNVAVIDTGIDYTHSDLGGAGTVSAFQAADASDTVLTPDVATGTVTIDNFPTSKVTGGYDLVGDDYTAGYDNGSFDADSPNQTPKPDPNPLDCADEAGGGHGSHVAGTVAGTGVNADGSAYSGPYNADLPFSSFKIGPGVAPRATLSAYRVFGCKGATFVVSQALDLVAATRTDSNPANDVDVMNLSLGADFTRGDDPDAQNIDKLAVLGVVPVVAAGNAGDLYSATGSPGTAVRALTVAASDDGSALTDGLIVSAPASVAKTYPGSLSAAYTFSDTKVGVTDAAVARPTGTPTSCAPYTDADKAAVAGKVAIVDADNFTCGSVTKTRNARQAGAVGVVIIDDDDGLTTGITGDPGDAGTGMQIPSILVQASTGAILLANLATLRVTISPASIEAGGLLKNPAFVDIAASFTSRGGTTSAGSLKPDVTAPGVSITSAKSGTGSGRLTISGTSMATPHTAGIAALVLHAHPAYSTEQVKAAIVGTALEDVLVDAADAASGHYPPTRVGTGRVRADLAASTDVLAYAAGGSGAVNVGLGPVDVGTPTVTITRNVSVQNVGTASRAYAVSTQDDVSVPGAVWTASPSSLTVGAGQTGTVALTVTLTRDALRKVQDGTREESPEIAGIQHFISESTGKLLLTPSGAGTALRVAYAVAPRPASSMRAGSSAVVPSGGTGQLALTGTGVANGPLGTTSSINSVVSAYQLQDTSAQLPSCGPVPSGTDQPSGCILFPSQRAGDLRYVGAATTVPSDGLDNGLAVFGLATYGTWISPSWNYAGGFVGDVRFRVYVDVDGDGKDDRLVDVERQYDDFDALTANLYDITGLPVGYDDDDLKASEGDTLLDQQFLNGTDGSIDTNVLQSDVLAVPVSVGALDLPANTTSFSYRVTTETLDQTPIVLDTSKRLTFDVAAPAVTVQGSSATGATVLFRDRPSTSLPVSLKAGVSRADLLLLHHHNSTGRRAEVVPVAPTSVPVPPDPNDPCYAVTSLANATIVATGAGSVTVTAKPGAQVELLAYSRPSTTFRVVRTATVGSNGTAVFAVRPPTNTRLYGRVKGCTPDPAAVSTVLNVRTALSLFVTRTGTRAYTFSGDSLPARPRGLIVSLYRVTSTGQQVLTSQTRASATDGEWTIERTFTGTGRFGFVVRTGQDLQNAPGSSNVRSLLVF